MPTPKVRKECWAEFRLLGLSLFDGTLPLSAIQQQGEAEEGALLEGNGRDSPLLTHLAALSLLYLLRVRPSVHPSSSGVLHLGTHKICIRSRGGRGPGAGQGG